jgi:hypothetical protein
VGVPGYQWVHLQLRRRVVEQLDKARGAQPREDYLVELVEADIAEKVAANDGQDAKVGAR